MFVNSN